MVTPVANTCKHISSSNEFAVQPQAIYIRVGVQVIMFELPKGVALVITSSAIVDKGFGCVAAECAAAVIKGVLAAAVWLPIFFRPRTLRGSACSAAAVSGALPSFSPI